MAVVGIRSRDQVWQLTLGILALTFLLLAAGYMAFSGRGGDSTGTAAEGVTVADQALVASPAAGPSDGNGAAGIGGQNRRSDGPIVDRSTTTARQKSTTTAPSTTVEAETTVKETTTTAPTTVETSEKPTTTTEKPTTTENPKTSLPFETTSTTEQEPTTTVETTTTGPTLTIGPPTTEQDHSITKKDLSKARKKWRSMGYDSYSMTVSRVCFCPREAAGPFVVVVRGGEVMSIKPIDGDFPVGDWIDPYSMTVPGLFDLVETGFDGDRMHVVFDERTGVPKTIEIDYIRLAADDEIAVHVRDFLPHRG